MTDRASSGFSLLMPTARHARVEANLSFSAATVDPSQTLRATVQARLQLSIGLLRAISPSFRETWGIDVYGAESSALADFRRIANAKFVKNGHQARSADLRTCSSLRLRP